MKINVKDLIKYIGVSLKSNLGLKLLALALAIMFWIGITSQYKTDREKTLYNLPVTVSGVDALAKKNLITNQEPATLISTASLSADIARDLYYDLTNDKIVVTLDLSDISEPGMHEVPLSATSSLGKVRSVSPATVTVKIDERMAKIVPIVIKKGEDATIEEAKTQSFWIGPEEIQPTTVTVTGSKDIVAHIAAAQIDIDSKALTSTVHAAMEYTLVDENGAAVSAGNYQASPASVTVHIDVLPTKRVKIVPTYNGVENLADNYEIVGFNLKPLNEILIAAPQAELDKIDEIQTTRINVEGRNSNILTDVELFIPNSVRYYEYDKVSVEVEIREKRETTVYARVSVRKWSDQLGYIDSLDETVTVTVAAASSVIRNFDIKKLEFYVDVTNQSQGQRELEIRYRWTGGLVPVDSITINPTKVLVTIE